MFKKTFFLLVVFAVLSMTYGDNVCGRPSETHSCGSACQTTCRNIGKSCPIVNIMCNPGCYCIDGYALSDQGLCIPVEECPKTQ